MGPMSTLLQVNELVVALYQATTRAYSQLTPQKLNYLANSMNHMFMAHQSAALRKETKQQNVVLGSVIILQELCGALSLAIKIVTAGS